ncbi:hypothetical protein ETAA8_04110 [Anatilimnocola aggregata]|uniref:Uncharacterized protein n=1 Tax=Anatilimnocola aggregata TaxID=2528021 RepID=A0A517Y544_9BACT|nr:hypothetical protein [Anatilimnocola aggregata]QDU25345.1 hypothetical protein ETAA8_04110 [Anatilimnocola aggregata]
MGLAQWMADWLVTDKVAQLAERIAGRSRLATYQRVCERLYSLEAHEARGYVRTRAATIVTAEADKLIAQEGVSAGKLRDKLIASAMDSLVSAILLQAEQARRAKPTTRRLAA